MPRYKAECSYTNKKGKKINIKVCVLASDIMDVVNQLSDGYSEEDYNNFEVGEIVEG